MHQHEVEILFEKLDIANALLLEIAQNTRREPQPHMQLGARVVRSLPETPRTGIPGGPPQFGAPRTAPEGEGDWLLRTDTKAGGDVG